MKEPDVKGRVAAALKYKQKAEKYFATMPLGKGYGRRPQNPLFGGGKHKDILKKAWGYRGKAT